LHAHLWGVRSTHRIPELATQLGLGDLLDRPVEGYSGGERRRLEIARALVSEPAVLFLDEPTVGLDPRIRHELLDVIAGLRARSDLTILITTHYLEEAERLCDRVGIVHSGVLVAVDSPRTLRERLGAEILEFRSGDNAQATLARLQERGLAGADAFVVGASVTVPLHDRSVTDVLAALDEAHVPVSEVATRAPTLDDVYLHYTGGLAQAA
jgi:ABC-2 type transport system ATP-binding protein